MTARYTRADYHVVAMRMIRAWVEENGVEMSYLAGIELETQVAAAMNIAYAEGREDKLTALANQVPEPKPVPQNPNGVEPFVKGKTYCTICEKYIDNRGFKWHMQKKHKLEPIS